MADLSFWSSAVFKCVAYARLVSLRRRCKVEQVVPSGAASVITCNGLSNVPATVAAAAADEDDEDDDVICLDDEPTVKPSNSQHSAGYFHFCIV